MWPSGFACLFHLRGGGPQKRFYHRCRQNCDPVFFVLFFLSHVFLFAIPGERGRRRGGGHWYLLVAIPHPRVISLPSPGMMGMLDVAGRQERFSAKTHTTQECLYWKSEDSSKASPIIWLNWSYTGPIILWRSCRLFWRNHPHRFPVEYCHRKPHFIRCTPRSSTRKKRVVFEYYVKKATTTLVSQAYEKITALRLVGAACRCTY